MHNICCDNCHSHVAKCLNIMGYSKCLSRTINLLFFLMIIIKIDKGTNYGMVTIGVWMFFYGKWVSFGDFLKTYIPFFIIIGIIVISSTLSHS